MTSETSGGHSCIADLSEVDFAMQVAMVGDSRPFNTLISRKLVCGSPTVETFTNHFTLPLMHVRFIGQSDRVRSPYDRVLFQNSLLSD